MTDAIDTSAAVAPASPIIWIMGAVLAVRVVGEIAIALVTTFHVPSDWQIVNKATIDLKELAIAALGGLLGALMPKRATPAL